MNTLSRSLAGREGYLSHCVPVVLLDDWRGQAPAAPQQVPVEMDRRPDHLGAWQRRHAGAYFDLSDEDGGGSIYFKVDSNVQLISCIIL